MRSVSFDGKTFFLLLLSAALIGSVVTLHDITTQKSVSNVSANTTKEATLDLKSQNSLNEFGSAVFTEVNGRVLVKVIIEGQPKASVQPLQIRDGVCGKAGAQKYALNSLSNGKSSTVLNTTLSVLLSQKPLSLNVYTLKGDTKTSIVCGNF